MIYKTRSQHYHIDFNGNLPRIHTHPTKTSFLII